MKIIRYRQQLSDVEAHTEMVDSDGAFFPPVALSLVLKYLSLEDRNRVRLACKQWNGVCNSDPEICINEKLVFWPTDRICDVRKCLELSRKKFLNVEFHTVHLNAIPEKTWEICGEKLRSIQWFDGQYPNSMDNTVWFIVRYCSKLQYFSRTFAYSGSNLTLLSKCVLNRMSEKNVVCNNLRCVSDSFDLSKQNISSSMFQKFPNISSLRIGKIGDSIVDPSKIPGTVKKLHLDIGPFYYPCHWLKYLNSNVKLNDLFLPVGGAIKNGIDQVLLPFFAQQSELESVQLVVAMNLTTARDGGFCSSREVELYKGKLILHILRSCYRLKELSVEFSGDCQKKFREETHPFNILDASIISKRIARLNSFRVVGFDYVELLRPPLTLPESSRLRSLQIPRTRSSYSWLLQCSMFCNLQCLELTVCDLPMLEIISQSQVELRTLKIDDLGLGSLPKPAESTSDEYRTCLKVIPNASFSKLEHLDIHGGPHAFLLLFLKFHFPVLKHFGLFHCYSKLSDGDNMLKLLFILQGVIMCLPERASTIQILVLHSDIYPYHATLFAIVVVASQKMPSLEILAFYSTDRLLEDQYPFRTMKIYLNECPMLRLIIGYRTAFFYKYNRKSRKLKQRPISVSEKPGFDVIFSFQKDTCCKLLSSNSWCL